MLTIKMIYGLFHVSFSAKYLEIQLTAPKIAFMPSLWQTRERNGPADGVDGNIFQ